MRDIIAEFFGLTTSQEKQIYSDFKEKNKKLKNILSKDKSLSFLEAYVLYLVVKMFKIKTVSELGVRYGISSRVWLSYLPKNGKLYGYDKKKLYNKRLKKITDTRFNFVKGDLPESYSYHKEDAIFYDAHPYRLTSDIAWLTKDKVAVHCFHDVGQKCFKAKSAAIPKEERSTCSEKYGWWERHVMAEVFTPDILCNDIAYNNGWKSVVIDDNYGIGVVKREGKI